MLCDDHCKSSHSVWAEVGQRQGETARKEWGRDRSKRDGVRSKQVMVGRLGEQKCGYGAVTHCLQDADGLLAQPDWVEHVIMEDGLKQVVLIVGFEGGLPSHHLIHQHPQGPPVH